MSRTLLIRGALAVSPGDDTVPAEPCDVLIEGSRIVRIDQHIDSRVDEVVEAAGMLLVPGMVDTHIHMWEAMFRGRATGAWGPEYYQLVPPLASGMTPQDVYVSTYSAAVELLGNGVTTVMNYCHGYTSSEHIDAELAALSDAGIRAVLGYELHKRPRKYSDGLEDHSRRVADAQRVHAQLRSAEQELITLGICLSEFQVNDLALTREEIALGREIGGPIAFHNNKPGEIRSLSEAGLLGPDILAVHGNFNTDEDLRILAQSQGSLSTQPQTEMQSGRRSMTMVGRAHDKGVRLALGIDVPALTDLGLLNEMRVLYLLQRYLDGSEERHEGRLPIERRPHTPRLSPADVLRFATCNGAAALGLYPEVGRIAVGCQADLVLVDTRRFGRAEGEPSRHVVMYTSYGDIDTVIVAGELRKRSGSLVGVDLGALRAKLENARERVLRAQ